MYAFAHSTLLPKWNTTLHSFVSGTFFQQEESFPPSLTLVCPPPRAFPATTLLIITLCNRIDVCAVVCSYQMPDVCCVLYHILPQVFGIQNYWNYFVTMCPLLLIVMHCGYFVADFFAFLNLPINKWVSL